MALLGIDIGGTKLMLTVGDGSGEPIAHQRRPMEPSGDPDRDLDRLVADARALWEDRGQGPLQAVGVSAPGPVDAASGMLLHPPNLPGWGEVALGPRLAEALGAPVRVENDANAAALAEWRFGAGRGTRDLVYLTMSTGIGGGLVLDGRLHRGAWGGAGEVGHVPIVPDGRECACGRHGCLEAYCGGLAWQARLREETPDDSDVMRRAGSRDAIRPEHLVSAALAGDGYALEEFARWRAHLVQGLVALVVTLEPERFVLGTIAVAAGEALCFAPLREALAPRLWPHQRGRVEIVPAGLGDALAQRAGLAAALEVED